MAASVEFALVRFLVDNAFEVVLIEDVKDFDDRVAFSEDGLFIHQNHEYAVKWRDSPKKRGSYFQALLLDVGTKDQHVKLGERRDREVQALAKQKEEEEEEEKEEINAKRISKRKKEYSPKMETKRLKVVEQSKKKDPSSSNANANANSEDLMSTILKNRDMNRVGSANHKAGLKDSLDSTDGDTDSDDENLDRLSKGVLISRINVLTMKLRKSRAKNSKLQDGYTTLKALPGYLSQLYQVASRLESVSTPKAATSKISTLHTAKVSSAVRAQPSATNPSTTSSPAPTQPCPTSPAPSQMKTCSSQSPSLPPTCRVPEIPEPLLAEDGDVLLDAERMRKLNHSTASKLVADMMTSLFTEDEIVTKTVTLQDGQDSAAALDATKMTAMKKYVYRKFPEIPDKADEDKGKKSPPWDVRFNKLCRWKKSNLTSLFKRRTAQIQNQKATTT